MAIENIDFLIGDSATVKDVLMSVDQDKLLEIRILISGNVYEYSGTNWIDTICEHVLNCTVRAYSIIPCDGGYHASIFI